MVGGSDLADQTVDRANIDASLNSTGSRRKDVARCMGMGENQNTPVADLPRDFASVFRALESLTASGWRFDDHKPRR